MMLNKNNYESQAKRAAEEKAESLFELRNIKDIHQIQKATSEQIQDNKAKLRDIVGSSYKDVIKSADDILFMYKRCTDLKNTISQLNSNFTSNISNQVHNLNF